MSIIKRKKRERPFAIIDLTGLNDSRLSWKAKGLLAYLISKPADWQIYIQHLKTVSKDGRDSTRVALLELIEQGYVKREKVRKEGRFSHYDYEVSDIPEYSNGKSENGKSENGKSENGKSENGKSENGKSENGKSVTTNKGINQIKKKQIKKKQIEGEGKKTENTPAPTPAQDLKNNFSTNAKKESIEPKNFAEKRKKVAPKKEKHESIEVPMPFEFDLNAFSELLSDYNENINKSYYHQKIMLHSTSKSLVKTLPEWKAYIKKWIFEDKENGKLKLTPKTTANKPEASEENQLQDFINRQYDYLDIEYSPEAAESLRQKLREVWHEANDQQKAEIEFIAKNIQTTVHQMEGSHQFISNFKINPK